jgi:DNA-binding NtrC family response regulator
MEIRDIESHAESCRIFLLLEDEKRGNMNRMEENFNRKNANLNELSNEHQIKKRILWLFVEDFFNSSDISLKKFMSTMERNIILQALERAGGHQKKAAEILGVKYRTLNEKLKRYQIRIQKMAIPQMPAQIDSRV